ncbi:MAG: RNA polymerase Rpb4 family protein [Candidatus Methanomethyliaceae archaeon]|nr:RNA polymerase Rpb4 family protein [Candidatus Methanomethyliaceae archaeon]MDW7970462.1 RNA polymerase Rpb4 family protein [Nitrososphaerota archaeon]
MPKEIVREEVLSLPQVKKLLEKRFSEGEPNYLQKITYDYVTKFSKLPSEKAEELLNKLKAEGISPESAAQIVNIMPSVIDELRVLVSTEKKLFLPSELEKILSIINSFRE